MIRETENLGDTRILAECPKTNVKDIQLMNHSWPNVASSLQETPMKPSQVPNKVSSSSPWRKLSLQHPQPYNRSRQSLLHQKSVCYSAPGSCGSFSPSINELHSTTRHRLAPLNLSVGSFGTNSHVPLTSTRNNCTTHKSQTPMSFICNSASFKVVKDLNSHSTPSHIRNKPTTKSKRTFSYSRSKNIRAQRHETQKMQDKRLPSSEPPANVNRSSQKRHREYEPCDVGAKKLCRQSENRQTHTPKHTADVPSSTSTELSSEHPLRCSARTTGNQLCGEPLCDLNPSVGCKSHESSYSSVLLNSCTNVEPAMGVRQAFIKLTPNRCITLIEVRPDSDDRWLKEFLNRNRDNYLKADTSFSVKNSQKDIDNSQQLGLNSCISGPPHHNMSVLSTKCSSRGNVEEEKHCDSKRASKPNSGSISCPASKRRRSVSTGKCSVLLDDISDLFTPDPLTYKVKSNPKLDGSIKSISAEAHPSMTSSKPVTTSNNKEAGSSNLKIESSDTRSLQKASRVSPLSSPPMVDLKPNSGSISCPASKRRRSVSTRKCSVLLDDITDLFTPDPLTYKVKSNPKLDGSIKSISAEAHPSMTSSKPVTTSNNKLTGSSNLRIVSPDTRSLQKASPVLPLVSSPMVVLKRIQLETVVGKPNTKAVKSPEKWMLNPNVSTCISESDTIQKLSPVHCSETPPQENQACEESKQQRSEDPLDEELDLMKLALDFNLSQSSSSEEEEEETLFSLHEMMNPVMQPLDTPEEKPPPEPSTHGHHSESKTQPLLSVTTPGIYKNSLDQMLKEKKSLDRAKEIEEQLLTACEEDLLKIAEYEKPEEINTEQQEFLQRYSLACNAIPDIPPGEKVFNLERFGQIFNPDMCVGHLKKSIQRALPISSPAQLKMHICVGMFQEVYNSHLPCPSQVSQLLFKLMSVHNERMVSEKTLKALCDIACTAAYQIVMNERQNFKVWVPTLADISLVLMNMGAAFIVLFPLENLQPSFTERDLVEDIVRCESAINKDQASFPEHNYNNILKYLSYCMTLCPRAYSDEELLLLLTVLSKVSLDTRLILQPSLALHPVQYKILYNIRNWTAMLPRICLALANLTDDHHNMCLLVQLLPHNIHRKHEVLQLRQHLSLSMISKLLDGHCTYRPAEKFKISELSPYLPLMRPSLLLGQLPNSKSNQKDMAALDQEAYYLCYSLLILANEASNFQPIFPASQKKEVQLLCSLLDTHIKCDIRESGECLYRSKVKDLVARMYTKWQILLQRTKPLDGKLYDYFLPSDIHNCQEEQDVDNSEDGEGPLSEEKDVYSEDEETDEGKDIMDDSEEIEDSTKSDKPDGAGGINRFRSVDNRAGKSSAVEGRGEVSEVGYEDGTSKERNMTTAAM